MSTLRINNIEAKSVPASPTLDEKIKLTNSSGDVLVHIDGKTSGITTIGINTTDGNIKFDANSNIVVTGIITATAFHGDGSNLTGIDASTLKFGGATKAQANAAGVVISGICTATSFSGDGSNLTGLSTPLSFRNLIINGAMLVDQRGDYSTNSSNASRQYGGPDRFHQYYYQSDETARYTFKQGGTGVSPVDKGFSRTAILDVTTAQATVDITAGQAIWTSQRIEANNASHLKYGHSDAESVTLSFWIKSSVIGNYSITYGHTNMDERYITTYTVNVADTWEKKTITFPGDTRSGKTIAATNGYGLEVKWVWMAGSNRVATPNQWATQGNKYGASGVTLANIFSSASNNLYLTGVQLEIGTTATPFEHRSFGDELKRCQRYYYRFAQPQYSFFGVGNVDGGDAAQIFVDFPTEMRVKPTSLETTGTASNYFIRRESNKTCTSVPSIANFSTMNGLVNFTSSGHGWSDGQCVFGRSNSNDAYLGFAGAEL